MDRAEFHTGTDRDRGAVGIGIRGRGRTLQNIAEAVDVFRAAALEARGVNVRDIVTDDFETFHEGAEGADAAAECADE